MNIRSLHKHKGELLAYLSNLPRFDVLVLTEIGARNIDLTVNLFDDYNFLYILPDKNVYWGVGIYVSDYLNDVFLTNSQSKKACTCPRCEIESLVIDFTHCRSKYTICGLYWHPNTLPEWKCYEIFNHFDVLSNVFGRNSSYSSTITFCYMHWPSFYQGIVYYHPTSERFVLWHKWPHADCSSC